MLAIAFALRNVIANILDGKGDFREQYHACAPSHTCGKSNPARVTSHDLYDHHAVVSFRRGVNFVHGVGGGGQRGIKAECDFGGGKIVVNRLGNADQFEAALKKLPGNFLRASPPMAIIASMPSLRELAITSSAMSRVTSLPFSVTRYSRGCRGSWCRGLCPLAAESRCSSVSSRDFSGQMRPSKPSEMPITSTCT